LFWFFGWNKKPHVNLFWSHCKRRKVEIQKKVQSKKEASAVDIDIQSLTSKKSKTSSETQCLKTLLPVFSTDICPNIFRISTAITSTSLCGKVSRFSENNLKSRRRGGDWKQIFFF
jgi:hypothetical protein